MPSPDRNRSALKRQPVLAVLAMLGVISSTAVHAGRPEFVLEIRNHLFVPAEIVIPANTRVKLIVYNRDPTPEEFESYPLNREKVIMGRRKTTIFLGPLEPRSYPFFGEFHPDTALGRIIVK